MTDFYAQLERQLVAAGYHRQTQGRAARVVAGRGRALLAVTAAVAVLGAGAAVALPPVFDTSSTTSRPAAPGRMPAPAPAPARAGSLAGIRVTILNGTTRTGMARVVADQLERRGAIVHTTSNARNRRGAIVQTTNNARNQAVPVTIVTYRRGAQDAGRRVAAALGAALLRQAAASAAFDRGSDVTVLVGLDRRRPLPPAPLPAPVTPRAPKATPPVPTAPLRAPSAKSVPVPPSAATVPLPKAPPAARPLPAQPKTP